MSDVHSLSSRLAKIEQRNSRVEKDKAWETSVTRKLCIAIFTYLAIALYLKFIVGIDPWVNAIVPAVGFLFSTFTLPFFRKFWEKWFYRG